MFLWSKGMNDVCTYTLFIVYTQLLRFVYERRWRGRVSSRRSNDEISNILLENARNIPIFDWQQNLHLFFFFFLKITYVTTTDTRIHNTHTARTHIQMNFSKEVVILAERNKETFRNVSKRIIILYASVYKISLFQRETAIFLSKTIK